MEREGKSSAVSLLIMTTILLNLDPTEMSSFNVNYLLLGPISKEVTLEDWSFNISI